MFFLATADADGQPDCSYKGGVPGFVRVSGDSELSFPSYDGNGMFRSLGNVLANPRVGLLFLDFERPRRLRVLGRARLEEPRGEFEGEQLVVRVQARADLPQLPALHPPHAAPRDLGLRAVPGARAARAGLEERASRRSCRSARYFKLDLFRLGVRGMDREFIARADDHSALRIWLRLLTCTQLIERRVRSRAARGVRHHAAALRPDGAARAPPRGPEDERALAPADGHRRQRHRASSTSSRRKAWSSASTSPPTGARGCIRLTRAGEQELRRDGARARGLGGRAARRPVAPRARRAAQAARQAEAATRWRSLS